MGKKIIITTEQYHRLVNSMTIEAHKANDILNEGAFDNIKAVLSAFSAKKSFKDDPATITAVGNKVIEDLDADIRKTDPDFPNCKNNTEFLNTVLRIGAVYDTVFGAVYLDPTESGYLTAVAANGIINDLRNYVKRIVDKNLKPIYKSVHEANLPAQVSTSLQGKGDVTTHNVGGPVAPIKGGSKNSRGGILIDLYKSMVNVDPASIPNHPPAPVAPTGTTRNAPRGTIDPALEDVYRSVLSLFKFIINNKKILGVRSGKNVGIGTAINKKMKAGDVMMYKGKQVVVVTPDSALGRTQVRNINRTTRGMVYAVRTKDLEKIPPAQPIQEGKYIQDPKTIDYLSKATSGDRIKLFENMLNYIDNLRNKIKGLQRTGSDPKLDTILGRFDSNPIMLTDFGKMFNVSSDNPTELASFKIFIDELLLAVYSGNLDRLAKFGGGLNKMNEAPAYNVNDPNKVFLADAQDRRAFKNNLIKFLSRAFELFIYLHSVKNPKKIKP